MLNYTHVIYKVTNLVTGKIYIGQHSTKNIDDGYLGSGIGIKNSIKKYGSSSFKKEILEICAKKDDLNIREIFWIKELKATDGKLGYNISLGGCGGLHTPNHFFLQGKFDNFRGHKHSEESKSKIRESVKKSFEDPEVRSKCSLKGEKNGFYGRKHSEETLEKLRKPKSEDHKKKISETIRMKNLLKGKLND